MYIGIYIFSAYCIAQLSQKLRHKTTQVSGNPLITFPLLLIGQSKRVSPSKLDLVMASDPHLKLVLKI